MYICEVDDALCAVMRFRCCNIITIFMYIPAKLSDNKLDSDDNLNAVHCRSHKRLVYISRLCLLFSQYLTDYFTARSAQFTVWFDTNV